MRAAWLALLWCCLFHSPLSGSPAGMAHGLPPTPRPPSAYFPGNDDRAFAATPSGCAVLPAAGSCKTNVKVADAGRIYTGMTDARTADADTVGETAPITQVLLALPGPAFPPVDFSREGFHIGGGRLLLLGKDTVLGELAESDHRVQTASSVWDCAIVLMKFLERLSHQADGVESPLGYDQAVDPSMCVQLLSPMRIGREFRRSIAW